MKFLITGANGQLAAEFAGYLGKESAHDVVALGKDKLNVADFRLVSDAMAYHRPSVVLNCSAYNRVDGVEEDYDTAYGVNAAGVKNLAAACKKNKSLLVHYSTDYVFDGTKEDFYDEDDAPNPINRYGESKLAGERLLAAETDEFLLFRVSWVFGPGQQNFFWKLSEWAKAKKVLKIVSDQVSVPTGTEDIVRVSLHAVEEGLRGLYHLTNSGYASRYESARYYAEKRGLSNLIIPEPSTYFPTPAKRPLFTAMANTKLSSVLDEEIPDWRDAVDRFILRRER